MVIGLTITDTKILVLMCMHHILLVEGSKPKTEAQCCLNPSMIEIIKKEILKLRGVDIIYPISNIRGLSPIQVEGKRNPKETKEVRL